MIRRNIIANVIGRAWGLASAYLFIPIYLRFLGAEAYGLVGFFATLSGVLAFADMGLTATLTREMARLSVRNDSARQQADLLRTFECAYMWIAGGLAFIIWVLGPQIADHWLKVSVLNREDAIMALRLMGIAITMQLPTNLYVGGLMGLQKQTATNVLQVSWSMLRGVGAVLVLWLVSPSIIYFFCWHLVCNLFYFIAARMVLWRAIFVAGIRAQFRWLAFKSTWRYAAGMAGMALVSTALMQTDKLVVSKLLPLETFGFYMLAVAIAGIPRMLTTPVITAVYPRLTGLVEQGSHRSFVEFYHRTSALLAVAILPVGFTLALFSGDFIFAWTGSRVAAEQVGLAARWLVIGEVMQAVAILPYYLALAHGNVRLNLQLGICAVIVITPLLVFLIKKYGPVGAGISWVVMNLCTLPPYLYLVHRRFLRGELGRWVSLGVVRPLLVAVPCVLLGRWLAPEAMSRVETVGVIALVAGLATVATATALSEVRLELLRRTSRLLGITDATG